MILPPSADGVAPIVYTYTVSGLGNPTGMTFDGTHIHIADITDDNVPYDSATLWERCKHQPFIPIPSVG